MKSFSVEGKNHLQASEEQVSAKEARRKALGKQKPLTTLSQHADKMMHRGKKRHGPAAADGVVDRASSHGVLPAQPPPLGQPLGREARGERAATSSKTEWGIGSEWAAVFAMVFVFIVGFLMGALTVCVCSLHTKVRHQRTPLEVAEQRHAPLVAADRRLDRERIQALGNRTPIPETFTVAKTSYDFHQTGCQ